MGGLRMAERFRARSKLLQRRMKRRCLNGCWKGVENGRSGESLHFGLLCEYDDDPVRVERFCTARLRLDK
jgi:hypothetical protein